MRKLGKSKLLTVAAVIGLAASTLVTESASANSADQPGYFHVWGEVEARAYDTQDDALGGNPNRIRLRIIDGTARLTALRDQGKSVLINTGNAEFRTGTTWWQPSKNPDTSPGTMLQLVGRYTKSALSNSYVASIVRPFEFAIDAHYEAPLTLRQTAHDGDFGCTVEGTVRSGAFAGWAATLDVEDLNGGSVRWTISKNADHLTGYTYWFDHDGFFGAEREEQAGSIDGGGGMWSGTSGASWIEVGCSEQVLNPELHTFDAVLQLDIFA